MAQSGAAFTKIQAGKRKVGARVRRALAAASQTFPVGAILSRDGSKNVVMGSSNQSQSVGIVGFALTSGGSKSASGLETIPYLAVEKDEAYKLTFSIASWIGTVHRGLTAGLHMDSAGSVCVKSGGASTCGTIIDAVEWNLGLAVADGDANPLVYFVFADAAIAQ